MTTTTTMKASPPRTSSCALGMLSSSLSVRLRTVCGRHTSNDWTMEASGTTCRHCCSFPDLGWKRTRGRKLFLRGLSFEHFRVHAHVRGPCLGGSAARDLMLCQLGLTKRSQSKTDISCTTRRDWRKSENQAAAESVELHVRTPPPAFSKEWISNNFLSSARCACSFLQCYDAPKQVTKLKVDTAAKASEHQTTIERGSKEILKGKF